MHARKYKEDVSKNTPQLIYDGECPFCRCWVARLHHWLNFPGAYVPYNKERHYPLTGISKDKFKTAVVFWSPQEGVKRGGAAVMHLLALSERWLWLVKKYNQYPFIRKLINWSYNLVSDHRPLFIKLTFCQKYKDQKPTIKLG